MILGILFCLHLTPTYAASKDKPSCSPRELAGFDCRVYQGDYNLRLLAPTIAWTDGTWHTVDTMPLKGEAIGWEKIQFGKLNGWPILQLWLWEKGAGETEVQNLHWYVASLQKRTLTWLSEGIVRKRRLEPVEAPEPSANAATPPTKAKAPQPKFLYDAWEKTALTPLKNGDLEWQLGSQKKILKREH